MMKRGDSGMKSWKWENQNWIPLRVINYSSMIMKPVKQIQGHWSRFHSMSNVRSQSEDNFHHSSNTKHRQFQVIFLSASRLHIYFHRAMKDRHWGVWNGVLHIRRNPFNTFRRCTFQRQDRNVSNRLCLPSHQPSEKSVEKHVNEPSSLVYHANIRGFSIKHFSLTHSLICLVRTWKYRSGKALVTNISCLSKAFRRRRFRY